MKPSREVPMKMCAVGISDEIGVGSEVWNEGEDMVRIDCLTMGEMVFIKWRGEVGVPLSRRIRADSASILGGVS